MSDQENKELRVVTVLLLAILIPLIASIIGLGVFKARGPGDAVDAAVAALAADGEAYADVAEVGEPLVKFHFAVGQTALGADDADEIAAVLAALKAAPGKRALLSGFHDETGTAAVNAEVARNRAFTVRDALLAAGVPAERVLMRRPAVTLGGGDAAEARRVEVRVQ